MNKQNPTEAIAENQWINQTADSLLEENSYYEKMANPLKSAEQFKAEHRKHLQEFLQFKDFKEKMNQGVDVVLERLPQMITANEWTQFKEDFARSIGRERHIASSFTEQIEQGQSTTFQNLMGISSHNMNHLYNLDRKLVEEKHFNQALAIFTMLTYLNPQVPEYWIGQAICLYSMAKYEEALAILQLAKVLQPDKVAPFIYSAFCNFALYRPEGIQQDLDLVHQILQHSETERAHWEEPYKVLKRKSNQL